MNFASLLQKVHSFACEKYFGIQTTGRVHSSVPGCGYYSALPYRVTFRILKNLRLTNADVFVDVGCGKGRVVCCACRLPLRRVVGLELNKGLLQEAIENVAAMRGVRSEFEPVAGPAQQYDFRDATVVFFFNPFEQEPMVQVINKLGVSYKTSARRIRIAYANCIYEKPMYAATWLRKCEEWPPNTFPAFGRAISFWESV